MSHASPIQTGIHLKTSFFPLAFILAFFKPDVSIDGATAYRVGWGETFLPGSPGPHRVNVWFNYMIFGQCGKAEAVVEVPTTGVLQLHYKAPAWLVFMQGKLLVGGAAAPAAIPAGPSAGVAPPPPPAPPVATAAPATPTAAAGAAADGPQWDAQRNAYVQFDPARQQWMQFDDPSQQWVPIS